MSRAVGVDCGTMFFQTAENSSDGTIKFKELRNAFVELEKTDEIEQVLSQNDWQYFEKKKSDRKRKAFVIAAPVSFTAMALRADIHYDNDLCLVDTHTKDKVL